MPDRAPRHARESSRKLLRVRLHVAIGSLGLLVLLLVAAWAHRFEPAPDAQSAGIPQLIAASPSPPGLRISQGRLAFDAVGHPRHATFTIPGANSANHHHIRYRAETIALEVGNNPWDDGRLFIEWRSPDGTNRAFTSIHSARGDSKKNVTSIVVHAPMHGSEPRLRMENLGKSGTYIVDQLYITPARQREIWKTGRWLLAAGFVAALAALVHNTKKPARWRGLAAASVWVIVAVHYVFPGPWDVARPFGVPMAFDAPALAPSTVQNTTPPAPSAAPIPSPTHHTPPPPQPAAPTAPIETKPAPSPTSPTANEGELGKIPEPDHLGLRIKQRLPSARPLLHFVLFFLPTIAFAWCVGIKRALVLALLLSFSIEAAQMLFGFGFGWDDVVDLIHNAVGIVAALWTHHKLAHKAHSRLPVPFPKPA